jgi:hypothetical protein
MLHVSLSDESGLFVAIRTKASWLVWLKPLILATWEAEIRRISVQGHHGQKVHKTPPQPIIGHGGAHLSFQQPREAQIRRS